MQAYTWRLAVDELNSGRLERLADDGKGRAVSATLLQLEPNDRVARHPGFFGQGGPFPAQRGASHPALRRCNHSWASSTNRCLDAIACGAQRLPCPALLPGGAGTVGCCADPGRR